jgi:hypothetical protein
MSTDTGTTYEGVVHFLAPLTVHLAASSNGARVVEYGHEINLTPAVRALNTGRDGSCVFDLLHDEGARVRRFGKVVMRPGPWPESVSRLLPGSFEWEDMREARRQAAWRIEDEDKRRQALAQLRADFPSAPTSRTLAEIRGDRV